MHIYIYIYIFYSAYRFHSGARRKTGRNARQFSNSQGAIIFEIYYYFPVFCYFFTPKPMFWVPWGVILVPLGSILVAWDSPGDSKVDPVGSEVAFSWILGALRVPVGGHFGTFLALFRICWCQNWRLGCGPVFYVVWGGKSYLLEEAGCCKNIINTIVFEGFHFFL